MRNIFQIGFWLIVCILTGCQADEIMSNNDATSTGGLEVCLGEIGAVEAFNATVRAQIDNTMSREIQECGLYYSETPNFSLGQAEKVVAETYDESGFSVTIGNLEDGNTYYFRFYVRHSAGLSLSGITEESMFTTPLSYRVPELIVTSEASIYERQIEAAVVHDGHYPLDTYGAYFSLSADMANEVKIEAEPVEPIDGEWNYTVNLPGEDMIPQNTTFYCQAYAVNERGEGRSEITEIKLERLRQYPSLEIVQVRVLSKTEAELTAKVLSQGYDAITEYGYYLNGTKVKVGEAIEENQTFTTVISGLTMGRDNTLYPYGVNSDGETPQPEEAYTFYTGIVDKYDPTIVYIELPPIEKDGKKYYFLDRNLGAKGAYETGSGPEDPHDAGWVFQWGRNADGHQLWTSTVKRVTAPFNVWPIPEEYDGFYIANASSWVWIDKIESPSYTTFWDNSESGGINNPCPDGYRVPTRDELMILFNNDSKLKVVNPGIFRAASDGGQRNGNSCYWTCEVDPKNGKVAAYQGIISSKTISTNSSSAQGNFIRPVRVE